MSISELTKLISPHFTGEVLNNILTKKSGLKNIEIKSIKMGGESKKGDSYLSSIYKFSVQATGVDDGGQTQDIFLPIIVKAIPNNVARRKTFRSVDFFETEIIFYEKVWPVMADFKKSKNLKDDVDEVPLVLSTFCNGLDDGYIAMEDLSFQKFGAASRSDGLDYEHTVLLVKSQAKFHAISLALKDQCPQFTDVALSLKETYFAEKFRAWYNGFQQSQIRAWSTAVGNELPPMYLEKLKKLFANDFFGTLCKLCEKRSPFSVVTQGDSWLPNFLIKYDADGKTPVEAIIIDFQLARYSNLVTDLTFLLYTCVNEDILTNRWDDIIEEYHKALTQRIADLGSNPDLVTLDALKKEIKNNAIFGVGMSFEATPMAMLEEHEVSDLDLIQGEEPVPLETIFVIPELDDRRNKKLAFVWKHAVDKGFVQ